MALALRQFERSVQSLIAANLAVLKQGMQLLARLDDAQYLRRHEALCAAGVGSHLRHCLDSYTSFLQGLETGLIDYDCRARDERLECDRPYAQTRIAEVMHSLAEPAT